jgi:replicative DNA helicase
MKNTKSNNDEINAMYGKVPPQAVEVEEAVLGALMLEAEAFESVAGIINTNSFYKDEHQRIFDTIKSIVAENKPVDLLTVTQELKDRDILNDIGGPGEITRLTSKVASAAHIESHARIIAEKHYLRESIRNATEIIELSYSDQDVELIIDQWKVAGEGLEDIFTIADTGSHIKQVLKNTIQAIEQDAAKASENKTTGIPTGFTGLDINTGGWKGGNLIVMAARPGVGKTSLALHFAMEAAKAGYWINIFSLEMNKEDLARILIATASGVYRSDIRDGFIKREDWKQINQAVAIIEKLPIIFRDAAGMNINQIKSVIRKNKKNGRCDFAIVDYLQLVKSASPKAIRELEVSEISRTLKTAALAENIPILALSQLNRDADGQMPKLSHLRESGAIEQDADIVIFLVKDGNNIRFSVAKHRRGRLCDIDIFHNEEMTKFSEIPNYNSPYPADNPKETKDPF